MRLPLPSKLLLSDIEIIKKQIFYPCPFELPAKQHRPVSPSWPNGRCCLAGNSKGHRRISKIFLSLFLYTWVDQNIFFPEIYNAPIISELRFTVCIPSVALLEGALLKGALLRRALLRGVCTAQGSIVQKKIAQKKFAQNSDVWKNL